MPESKQAMRARYKALRNSLSAQERADADAGIARVVCGLEAFAKARIVCAYRAFGTEIDTAAIANAAWSAGKTVAFPRVVPGTRLMEWYAMDSFEGMVRSSFGVEEPDPASAGLVDVNVGDALVLVPGLAFDLRGYRIGYGGGFYDVFLSDFAGRSVGLCRNQQLATRLECVDELDRRVEMVATQTRLIQTASGMAAGA